ncbi:glycoside hydrolase/deacetylase [Lentinus tigrinus ALCF2SS1-7]|uniref:chitin deacetylase n=1 Tax=Lentinus tigrinus ALCF2SS1-6 TaxID=1328759 RepID=A0A5C2T565_9APHY|nr:glycoside hydrolase/deacetylase [Lentinus tigrinus ALCF2SS1-6]RPD81079.1 glycoside hydrolase/deacetylase [Lentinus tigrinus ALCF2SS1-7]
MPSAVRSLLFLAVAALSATASPYEHHDHDHAAPRALPGQWFHREEHPAYALFRRGDTDGITYPEIGSQQWSAGFPQDNDVTKNLPQAWLDALDAAVKAGTIPDIPVSTSTGGNPTYPQGFDPNGPTVCSATYKCVNKEDLWDAPDGVFGSSFDDGPLPTSMPLYQFLKENNVITTHFMIGSNILWNADAFKYAFETLESDLAVHTWTHPYMTTKTNQEVVGELGWTMELIHNSTGGRLPKYWRPPYGDSDERVRAIAKEVFGLRTVIWNQDSEDWSISTGGTTRPKVDAELKQWITGPKSPGLIILEHELTNDTVGAFMQAFPLIAQNGWKFESVARLDGGNPYQNSADDTSDVTPQSVGVLAASSSTPSGSSSAGSPTGSSAASKPSGSGSATSGSGSATSGSSSASPSATGGAAQDHSNGAMSHLSWQSAALTSALSVLAAAFALS